jgi:hypothetical protein
VRTGTSVCQHEPCRYGKTDKQVNYESDILIFNTVALGCQLLSCVLFIHEKKMKRI